MFARGVKIVQQIWLGGLDNFYHLFTYSVGQNCYALWPSWPRQFFTREMGGLQTMVQIALADRTIFTPWEHT